MYDRGWFGINIDPNVDTIKLFNQQFNQQRNNDINLQLAVAEEEGEFEYYKFLEIDSAGGGSGNSLDPKRKEFYERQGLKATSIKVRAQRLDTILETYSSNKQIDFLNIDVEKVLKSNNWDKFRPKIIAVEIYLEDIDYDNTLQNEVYKFLRSKGYKAFSSCLLTWFFYDANNHSALQF